MNADRSLKVFCAAVATFLMSPNPAAHAQQPTLPNAPSPRLLAQANPPAGAVQEQVRAEPSSQNPSNASRAAAPQGPRLTLAEAERIALQHNPTVSIAHLLALAQAQVVRETRSAELPT